MKTSYMYTSASFLLYTLNHICICLGNIHVFFCGMNQWRKTGGPCVIHMFLNIGFHWHFNNASPDFITVTSQWVRWRLKSPASRLFTQPFVQGRSKKTSKLRVTGLCGGNSPVTGEFPAQMASNAENVSIWWRHHVYHHDVTEMWSHV